MTDKQKSEDVNDDGTNINYLDLEPDTLGNLKSIKRLPAMKNVAPKIQWGIVYLDWPIKKRLKYAEKLAASMNHAADVLQQERNKLVKIALQQEEQLKANIKTYAKQGEIIHQELVNTDAEKQKLYQKIVILSRKVKQQAIQIKELEDKFEITNKE